MNRAEAKAILVSYRPGSTDARDPEVAEALALAQSDPELGKWLEQQFDFHRSVRQAFHDIPTPDNLRDRILARPEIVAPPFWTRRQGLLAAAATIVAFFGLLAFWLRAPSGDAFQTFRTRMVRTVLRQYSMGIETNDIAQVRSYLSTRNAPSNFVLRPGLAQLPVTGAGVLSWQRERVSMVCLNGGAKQGTLFLFVVDRAAVKGPPSNSPVLVPVSKLMTASWTAGDRTYVLAGRGDKEALQRFF